MFLIFLRPLSLSASISSIPMSVLVCAMVFNIGNSQASINIDANINNSNETDISTEGVKLSIGSQQLFAQCATVQTDAARLACYDKVAHVGISSIAEVKKPLDIAKSVQVSFKSLKPQVVMATTDDLSTTSSGNNKPVVIIPSEDDTTEAKILTSTQLLSPTDEARVLEKVGVTSQEIGHYTPLSLAYDLDKNSVLGVWSARPYNPMYLLPVYYTFNPNRHPSTPTQDQMDYNSDQQRNLELKAQVSLKSKIMEDLFDTNADLWFGYTQQMHWQVYNKSNSRPFRATDYEPEIFLTQPVTAKLPYDGRLRMLGAGVIHHSNGQSDPLSRSWNRIYLMGGAEWGNLSVIPRVWMHVKDEKSSIPSDNPDITDYYGHGDIKVLYDLGQGRTFSGIGRYNFKHNNGALQLDYTQPLSEDIYGFVQLFHGYGESIIDYNKSTTAIGLGISLNDWKGL